MTYERIPLPIGRTMSPMMADLIATIDAIPLAHCFRFNSAMAASVRQASQFIRRRDGDQNFAIRKLSANEHAIFRVGEPGK